MGNTQEKKRAREVLFPKGKSDYIAPVENPSMASLCLKQGVKAHPNSFLRHRSGPSWPPQPLFLKVPFIPTAMHTLPCRAPTVLACSVPPLSTKSIFQSCLFPSFVPTSQPCKFICKVWFCYSFPPITPIGSSFLNASRISYKTGTAPRQRVLLSHFIRTALNAVGV